MIDVNNIKLNRISFERLGDFIDNWLWSRGASNKADRLKHSIASEEKKILRNQCDSLIALFYKVRKEFQKRKKLNPKPKGKNKFYYYPRIHTGISDVESRIDYFTGKKFNPKIIDKRQRYKSNHDKLGNYHWLKERYQKLIFECKICKKKLYSAEDRLKHAKETNWIHNKVKEMQLPVLSEHPHYICPQCNTLLPTYYVKENTNNGIFYCEVCDLEIEKNRLKYVDPYYEEQLKRICLNCLRGYKLSKTRWYAQGVLCLTCKEKEETYLKNLKKKRNTP